MKNKYTFESTNGKTITIQNPCKLLCCLKYPICLRKEKIECERITKLYETFANTSLFDTGGAFWKMLRTFFPNITQLKLNPSNDPLETPIWLTHKEYLYK
jgi:hypothetical protein